MKKRAGVVGFLVAGFIGIVATGGCTSTTSTDEAMPSAEADQAEPASSSSSASSETASSPAVLPLPDLSVTDEFVGEQIRSLYASLQATLEDPDAGPAARAEAHGEMGKLLMAATLLDGAEPFFLQAQAELPADTRWSYYLGHLYATQGALDQSVAAFEEVLRLEPDNAVAMVSLGDVHLLQGRPEEAEPLFRKQLTLQPNSVVANVGLGRAALARDNYDGAVRHLEEGLRLSEYTAVGLHYPLGLAYRGLGQQEKAEEHLAQRAEGRVLPEDPLMQALETLLESPTAFETRGNLALTRREWTEAAENFRKGLALDPDNPTLRHRLGTALFQLDDPGAAAAQWEQVVQTSPDFVLAHFSLGVLLEGAGLRSEAIEHFETAVRHQPDYVEARLGLATLLRRAGRLEDSLSQYDQVAEQALTGDPRFEEAPFGAAITLVRLGRYGDARDRLRTGMAEYPNTPFFAHALARLLSGSPDAAVRDGQGALRLLQALPEELQRVDYGETLAMTLAEVGQFADATAIQREAINLATRNSRDDLLPRMQEKLRRYEDGRPWRNADPVEFDPFLERSATRR